MKMILADDETIITKGIQKLIDWPSLGIEVVGAYEDGKKAFDGIIKHKPEIALLDISMPGMSGIEILKECNLLHLKTKIIFISGFQDFEYARDAVKYGAVDYLLKPVIRDELLTALEKCFNDFGINQKTEGSMIDKKEENDYEKLSSQENVWYQPVYAMIRYTEEVEESLKKLVDFSVMSFLESYIEERRLGIVFLNQENICIVLKKAVPGHDKNLLKILRTQAIQQTGQQLYFVSGRCVENMGGISAAFQECLAKKGYLFFSDAHVPAIIDVERPVFERRGEDKEKFESIRENLTTAVINRDRAVFEKAFDSLEEIVCRMSDGKREDACFYFCTTIRMVEAKLAAMGFRKEGLEITDILEISKNTTSYSSLAATSKGILEGYMGNIQKLAEQSERQTYLNAKRYMEEHYSEELTLNSMAEYVHMNPYYFSAFFKKYAGENFKAYVNKIRLEQAVALLLSTNKKIIDIAMETGFSDTRAFSAAFQKNYHETPNAYRKRMREE